VGGARITIRDEATAVVLAEGFQEGGGEAVAATVRQRQAHEEIDGTPGAAPFEATLTLERPTVVEITAEGPLGFPQATRKVSKTLLLVPGENVLGDGILLEIHGFIIELDSPPPEARPVAGLPLGVRATVRSSSGRPTAPDKRRDAGGIRILARLVRGSERLAEAPLTHTDEPGTYAGTLPPVSPGPAELVVLALDPAAASFGRFRQRLEIEPVSPP
jgi:hypothetical protein